MKPQKIGLIIFLFPIIFLFSLEGCGRHTVSYEIISYSTDPVLGGKFVLRYHGRPIIAKCCMPKNRGVPDACVELQKKIGQTVEMEFMKFGDYSSDVLVYHPKLPDDSADHLDEMVCVSQ